jgi:hypothetical protein
MTLLAKPPPPVPLQQRATNNDGDQEDEIIMPMIMMMDINTTGQGRTPTRLYIDSSFPVKPPQLDGKKNLRLALQLSLSRHADRMACQSVRHGQR